VSDTGETVRGARRAAKIALRRLVLPPRRPEHLTEERIRALAAIRMVVDALGLGGNLFVFELLRGSPLFRPEVVRLGATLNVTLLSVSLVVTALFLRRRSRGYRPLLWMCVLCDMLAGAIWLQLTGTVSSYYLAAGLVFIPIYRLGCDYGTSLVYAGGLLLAHNAAFALEEAGYLRPASVFAGDVGGIYASSIFRWAAMSSITWCYVIIWTCGNFIASVWRDKEAEVLIAREDLQRVVENARHGRLSGTVLEDKYELQDLLGRGGMGEVYQAHRISDGKSVAIKVLLAHHDDSLQMRERFRREAEAAAKIPAAHVAELYEFGTSREGQAYIVMELLRGEDLGAMLRRRGKLPPTELCVLADKLAAALDAAHDAGIVHRDLKPQNVFVQPTTGGDDVRLVDFGVARLLEGDTEQQRLTQTHAVLGTAGYLAPEQAIGTAADIGPHTDVFALSAIVYRALTGKNAFPARHPAAAIHEALNYEPPPPSHLCTGVHADVDAVIALGLAKRPRDRYRRASTLAADLRRAFAGELPAAVRARAGALPGHAVELERTLAQSESDGG
jgi:hypothetical protein